MIYFTSDLHFGHENIIRFCDRPFKNAEEMDKVLIENWNNTVHKNDTVYVLGDFTMIKDPKIVDEYISKLNGRIFFLHGNHDGWIKNYDFDKNDKISFVGEYLEVAFSQRRIILFHYPIDEWNHYFRDSYHFHGHQHNHEEYNTENIKKGLKRFDVGVDANDFKPISVAKIIEMFEND